jgi:hypothetical protein
VQQLLRQACAQHVSCSGWVQLSHEQEPSSQPSKFTPCGRRTDEPRPCADGWSKREPAVRTSTRGIAHARNTYTPPVSQSGDALEGRLA